MCVMYAQTILPEVGVEGEGLRSSQGISVPVNWVHTQSNNYINTEHIHSQNQTGSVQHCDTLHLTVLTGWRRGEASLWWYEGEFPSVLRKGRSLGRADAIMEKEAGWERRKVEYNTVHVIMHVNMLT